MVLLALPIGKGKMKNENDDGFVIRDTESRAQRHFLCGGKPPALFLLLWYTTTATNHDDKHLHSISNSTATHRLEERRNRSIQQPLLHGLGAVERL
jgi:hypothetical protein